MWADPPASDEGIDGITATEPWQRSCSILFVAWALLARLEMPLPSRWWWALSFWMTFDDTKTVGVLKHVLFSLVFGMVGWVFLIFSEGLYITLYNHQNGFRTSRQIVAGIWWLMSWSLESFLLSTTGYQSHQLSPGISRVTLKRGTSWGFSNRSWRIRKLQRPRSNPPRRSCVPSTVHPGTLKTFKNPSPIVCWPMFTQ